MANISIHVPTRGTTQRRTRGNLLFNFNPRAHEGHDADEYVRWNQISISIHVPTRGTTQKRPIGITGGSYFNPRAHEGHDIFVISLISQFFISIHVPTRGTTPQSVCPVAVGHISIHVPTRGTTERIIHRGATQYFNPRAHEGHDQPQPNP